jgi:molecular chaperone DnaK
VHVSAKDLGTGKEQSIKITASSGLSEDEIRKMVKDAEAHAGEDRKKRETVEARNQLDSLVYTTEKTVAEHGDQLDAATKSEIEDALAKAKKALDGSDADAMRKATEELSRTSHKLAEKMYARASKQDQGPTDQQASGGNGAGSAKGDDVVDADFEEVKE